MYQADSFLMCSLAAITVGHRANTSRVLSNGGMMKMEMVCASENTCLLNEGTLILLETSSLKQPKQKSRFQISA